MTRPRVAHLTSVHARYDVRVFLKECTSLATFDFDVHLVVADGKGDEVRANVRIHDVGAVQGRLRRMTVLPLRIWKAARRLRPDIIHIHDAELLPLALVLEWSGARAIYDSHEDLPRAILSKEWIDAHARRFVSWAAEVVENFIARRLSAIVAATPHIAERFSAINPVCAAINNFPLASELATGSGESAKDRVVCYVGAISRHRGIMEMISAVDMVDARLVLAGSFENDATEREARALPGWAKVDYRGVVGRDVAQKIMTESRVGMLLFHPEPNHVEAQPNKMFEYMSARLPVLASDFPLWREIIDGGRVGLCVEPTNLSAIAQALAWLLDNPEEARAMGERGQRAVRERYQWAHEEKKLHGLYAELLA